MLAEPRRQQLDGIVQQMTKNNESDSNIQAVVDDFKHKYDTETPLDLKKLSQPAQPTSTQNFGNEKQGVLANLPGALADTVVGAGKAIGNALGTSEKALGTDVGQSLAYLSGTGKMIDKTNQGYINSGDMLMKAAMHAPDNAKKQQFLQQAQEAYKQAGTTYQEVLPSIQKSATQILGEGAGTFMDFLSAGIPEAKGLAGKVGIGAGLGYGYDVSQNLQGGKTGAGALTPGLGTVVGAATPFATTLVGSLAKKIGGTLSGAGTNVVQRAVENPDVISEAMTKYAKNPEAKQQLLNQADEAVQSFSNQKNQEYANSLSKLQATAPVSKDIVTQKFQDAVKNFGGRIDEKGNLIIGDSSLTSVDRKNLTDAWESIKGWKDVTPQGLDTLRQNIGNHMKDFKVAGNPRANVVLGQVKTALTNAMKKNIPGYDEVLLNYGDKAEAATEFAKEFQLSGSAKDSSKLNNIMRLFKKDPAVMQNLEKVMGKSEANKFQNEVAGAILSNWVKPNSVLTNILKTSGEIGAIGTGLLVGNPTTAIAGAGALAATSPKIVGKAATTVGKLLKTGVGTAAKRLLIKKASGQ